MSLPKGNTGKGIPTHPFSLFFVIILIKQPYIDSQFPTLLILRDCASMAHLLPSGYDISIYSSGNCINLRFC